MLTSALLCDKLDLGKQGGGCQVKPAMSFLMDGKHVKGGEGGGGQM